jgi:hypothetical protein
MSDEHSLWNRIRNSIGHVGHWQRLEFNPEAGIPDVNFCIAGVEGMIELKHTDEPPVREATRVFGDRGLRKAQIAWIKIRQRVGGRIFICSQVGRWLFLTPGFHAETFNEMSLKEITRTSVWNHFGTMRQEDWVNFVMIITGPLPKEKGRKKARPLNLD